ncbi:MAG: L-threonylcarbamoyladenylate synthase [Planctomycetaceae bacterium]
MRLFFIDSSKAPFSFMSHCPVTTDIDRAAAALRDGRLVAFGTETVYGLGANALDVAAVAAVFEAKDRPYLDPLIVHIADTHWLPQIASDVSPTAQKLIQAFWPGPLTLVLPKTELIPDLVTSGLPSVAIRMPAHSQARELLLQVNLPIAAPSANPFGQLSPTTAEHVATTLGNRLDLILDGGPCRVGVESSVILMTESPPRILRHGGITQEQIEDVIGTVHQTPAAAADCSSTHSPAPSPGMQLQHYSPGTPLAMVTDVDLPALLAGDRRIGALTLSAIEAASAFDRLEVLSPDRNLRTAAAGFFAALRRLDAAGLAQIVAWPFPDEGLGRALNDRLHRACHT